MARFLVLASTLALAAADAVRDELDCKMRSLAIEFAAHIQPWRPASTFAEIADALNGASEKAQGCTVAAPAGLGDGGRRFGPVDAAPRVPLGGNFSTWYVSPAGSDSNDGSVGAPFATLPRALAASRANTGSNQIVLRAGTYFLASTIVLGAADAGLVVQSFPGEEAWVSGAIPLPTLAWKPYNVSNGTGAWEGPMANTNAVFAAQPGAGIVVFGTTPTVAACESACEANYASTGQCTIYTWHDTTVEPQYVNQCWFRTDGIWAPHTEAGHFSGRRLGASMNVWMASLAGTGVTAVPGLRLDGARLTRARYPNGFPETKGFMPPVRPTRE